MAWSRVSLHGRVSPSQQAVLPSTDHVSLMGRADGEWWDNTGYMEARRENDRRLGLPTDGTVDALTIFFHDVPEEVTAEAMARGERGQSTTPFIKPWPLDAWPDVPTEFLLCRNDCFFPAPFMRRVVKERLSITPDEMESGHVPALSHESSHRAGGMA